MKYYNGFGKEVKMSTAEKLSLAQRLEIKNKVDTAFRNALSIAIEALSFPRGSLEREKLSIKYNTAFKNAVELEKKIGYKGMV